MTDRIEPALTAEEWGQRVWSRGERWIDARGGTLSAGGEYTPFFGGDPGDHAAMIALANAALPDSDPRKITRDMVDDLHMAASHLRHEYGSDDEDAARVEQIADALESYLPPE